MLWTTSAGRVYIPKGKGDETRPIGIPTFEDKVLQRAVTMVLPRLKGRGFLVRFADDAVMGFECESDARRVLEVLPKRFARFEYFGVPHQ